MSNLQPLWSSQNGEKGGVKVAKLTEGHVKCQFCNHHWSSQNKEEGCVKVEKLTECCVKCQFCNHHWSSQNGTKGSVKIQHSPPPWHLQPPQSSQNGAEGSVKATKLTDGHVKCKLCNHPWSSQNGAEGRVKVAKLTECCVKKVNFATTIGVAKMGQKAV